jgi:hypothetical protein
MDGGLGVLFSEEDDIPHHSVPNPYAPSSSSEDEIEPDLDRVADIRRSVRQTHPISDRARKGWIAHQSVFPPSSSSSATESDKETEEDTDDEGEAPPSNLREPLLAPEGVDRTKIPVRLQVYHGRFGHWEREGLRKYKGAAFRVRA